tara:strand:- start:143 stop:652 length:510 start_codon:yes stop_codon:yes gene_type:complete
MGLNTEQRQDVIYFVGTEVEQTPQFGARTLFVVGVQPVAEIAKRADERNIEHIYLGTSQSFHPENIGDWNMWNKMICGLIAKEYKVTLDFKVEYIEDVAQSWNQFGNFIPMISVVMPNIRDLNYNTTIKIDDKTWGHSNPGVWCHSLHEMTKRDNFTSWDDYPEDERID